MGRPFFIRTTALATAPRSVDYCAPIYDMISIYSFVWDWLGAIQWVTI